MAGIDAARAATVARVAAWPRHLLTDRPGGEVAGFVMPRFDAFQPVQHLYNPAQRRKFYPRADWSFLVHVARNTAAAFDEIHQLGCVVGDVNQSNVLVSEKGLVGLIDCDSFQVAAGGRVYCCEVAVPLYTPPELQSATLRGLVRTANHDRFGIAVLIFQLLFVGRHPYAGTYNGAGDPPFEQLIKEFRFAYGMHAARLQMQRPPHTPDLDFVPGEVRTLFERAFLEGSQAPDARPTAVAWVAALDRLRGAIARCKTNAGHKYSAHLPGCPWCGIVSRGGPDYFVSVVGVATLFEFDVAKLRLMIGRFTRLAEKLTPYDRDVFVARDHVPGAPMPVNPKEHVTVSLILAGVTAFGVGLMVLGLLAKYVGLFGIAVTLAFSLWLLVHTKLSPLGRERRRRRQVLAEVESSLHREERSWVREYKDYLGRADEIRRRFDAARDRCERLQSEYATDRRRLESNRETLARADYLRAQFIVDADIPGIGPGRKQTLAAFNIETAFDVSEDRIRGIKGFGPAMTGKLLAWRQQVLAAFRFDPKSGVPEADLRDLAARYTRLQAELFSELDRQTDLLAKLVQDVEGRRQMAGEGLKAAFRAWAKAHADVEASKV
jgi:DNA-binding helix-hairpin-helix protein with protein kinase domain